MTSRCLILSNNPPSYPYEGFCVAKDDATVDAIFQTIREYASDLYRMDWKMVRLGIDLYQPNKLLGVKDKTSADAAAVLRKTINDDYLKFDCHRIVSKSFLERPECLIAVVSTIFDYIVYERPYATKSLTCLLRDDIERSASAGMVQLVQKIARQTAENHLSYEGRGVVKVDVYETTYHCDDFEEKPPGRVSRSYMTSLTPAGAEPGTPRGRSCLYIEIVSDKYIKFTYHVFREVADELCTYLATGWMKALPQQTFGFVEEEVRAAVRQELADPAGALISIYQLSDESGYKSHLSAARRRLGSEYFLNLTKRFPSTELRRATGDILIVLLRETPKQPPAYRHERWSWYILCPGAERSPTLRSAEA